MKFIVGFGVFVVALMAGANFTVALLVAVIAGILVAVMRGKDSTAESGPHPQVYHLRLLEDRIRALEEQVAALKGEALPPRPVTEFEVDVDALERETSMGAAAPQGEAAVPQPEVAPPPSEPVVSELPPLGLEPIPPEPAPAEPPPPPEPPVEVAPQPSFFSNLLSGNIVAKVGAIILFFGVGFLLKFAYDRGLFPPEARLAAVALAAAVVFIVGWKLRESRRLYGLILQGVASGLAYLTVFFALKTYGFIGVPVGFSLFALLGVATTMLAVRQDAKPLAVLGLTGAFLAPILATTGAGNHVFLFSYYLLLNAFILWVSWFKAWRVLNLTGWLFTFGIAAFWGWRSYTPEMFGTVEPFLLAFFAMYLVIPVLFATRQPPELKGLVDGTLVFGTPAAMAVMQSRLVWDMAYGLAWSAAVGAALYAVLAVMVLRHRNMRLLGQTYVALALGLGTLAIAFAFGAYTTFALWTIEGTAILWVCLRQRQLAGRLFAIVVQLGGAVQFFLDYLAYPRSSPWFNDAVFGLAILAVAGFISAALYRRHAASIHAGEKNLDGFFVAWGAFCYALGGLDAIHHGVSPASLKPAIAILFFSGSFVVAEVLGARLGWKALRGLTVMHLLVLGGVALYQLMERSHLLGNLGWIAWPAGLGSLFWMLHRQRRDKFNVGLELSYAGGWVLLALVATWEARWWLQKREYAICMGISLVGYAAGALRFRLREHGTNNPRLATIVLAWAMFFWFAGGWGIIDERLPSGHHVRALLLFVTASAVLYELVYAVLEWPAVRAAARLPWAALPLAVLFELADSRVGHPLSNVFALAWPLAWLFAVYTLWREERDGQRVLTEVRHAIALYLAILLATWELVWWLAEWDFGGAWTGAALAIPASVALLLVTRARDSRRWPLAPHWPQYRTALLPPLVGLLLLWSFVVNVRAPGSLVPFPMYLPLANPIDLAIGLAAFAVVAWGRTLQDAVTRERFWIALAALGFVWLNATALRTIHFWEDVPYRVDAMLSSVLVQATLSILWTTAALALMVVSRKRMDRRLWLAGAALLAVVVAKLFLMDLANTGTMARIVSFLGVGVMLLVIGYVAPVPPGLSESSERRV